MVEKKVSLDVNVGRHCSEERVETKVLYLSCGRKRVQPSKDVLLRTRMMEACSAVHSAVDDSAFAIGAQWWCCRMAASRTKIQPHHIGYLYVWRLKVPTPSAFFSFDKAWRCRNSAHPFSITTEDPACCTWPSPREACRRSLKLYPTDHLAAWEPYELPLMIQICNRPSCDDRDHLLFKDSIFCGIATFER
jgi:hypothetical protein